jgi:hypothetical protein
MNSIVNKKIISSYFFSLLLFYNCSIAANLNSIASGNWSDANIWQITISKSGTITANTNSRIITGNLLADFNSNISVGNQILNTSNQVIGVVESIQSATSLTLVANAAFQMSNAGWNSRGIAPTDFAIISSGHNITLDGNFTCATLRLQTATANNSLSISGTNTLNVTGNISIDEPDPGFVSTINVNDGTITAASLGMKAGFVGNNNIVNISSGRFNINGNVNAGGTGCQINITSNGTIKFGGTASNFTFNLGSGASTVIYDANAAQTMRAMVYHNLTIAGSGIKTVTTSTTVNGTLTLEGTATLSSAINTYGANAGIRYNTTINRSTDIEWPTIFSGTGGITIENTGAILLLGSKTLNTGAPMQVLSGASFSANNFAINVSGNFLNAGSFTSTTSVLTFNANLTNQGIFNANSAQIRVSGDFINTGTYIGGSSQFNIRGSASTQNIDGFSTSGSFRFSKPAGTATLLGNVTAGVVTIDGLAGILDFGTNRNHLFSGALSLDAGTLNGNSSTITFNGSISGTGVVFNPGTSTVKYTGTAQSIPGFIYHNLELGGSGAKTMATNLNTINNLFTISGTANVSQRATLGIGGNLVLKNFAFFRATDFNLNINDSLIVGNGVGCIFRISAIRARQFNNIVINSSGTFGDSLNSNYTINGNIRCNGTFLSGTGSAFLAGFNKTISGSISFNNLVTLSGSYTNNGTLSFNRSPLGTGTLTNGSTGTLNFNFGGNVGISNVVTTTLGNTVAYNFSGDQTIYPDNYFNLILSGSGTKTMSIGTTLIANNFTLNNNASCTPLVNTSIGNNVSINNSAALNFGAFTYTIGGNFTASSGTLLTTDNANFIFSGINKNYQNLNGLSNLNSIQILNGSVNFLSNISVNDLNINTNGVFNFSGFSASIEIKNTISGSGKINAGTCNTATNSITLSGSNANMGTLFLDPVNNYLQNLNLTKTSGQVIIDSDIGIVEAFNLPNSGNAIIEFKHTIHLANNFVINHPSNSAKVALANTTSVLVADCNVVGSFVSIPSNLFVTPPIIKKLSINKQNGLQLGNDVISVSEELSVTNGNLNTNNNLVLLSTGSKTARVAKVTGSITGNVTVQRYIPGGNNKRQWRFLSSPINVNGSIALTQYQDDIFVTAPAEAAGGFDVNPFARNASIRTYDETVSGSLNNGWTNPTNINNTIPTGIGAEVFVRGSRNLANPYLLGTVPDDVIIDFIGSLNTGSFSPSISFTNTSSGTNDGFNLIGNPYASPINFDTIGWTRTNIENKYWCFNPNTTLWGSYNANSGESINGMTKYISSGQAFFIKATAPSPVITFTEDVKSINDGNHYFKGIASQGKFPALKISLTNSYSERDETLFILDPSSTRNSADPSDMLKFYNNKLNIYSISSDKAVMSMNAIPLNVSPDTLGFSVWSYDSTSISTAKHTLEFSRLESIDLSIKIYLLDLYTKTITDVRDINYYEFMITNDANSYGNSRFKIIFDKTSSSLNTKTYYNYHANFILYPNPSSSIIFIQNIDQNLDEEICKYEVFDLLGRKMFGGTLEYNTNISSINIEELPTGTYVLRIQKSGKYNIIKFSKK